MPLARSTLAAPAFGQSGKRGLHLFFAELPGSLHAVAVKDLVGVVVVVAAAAAALAVLVVVFVPVLVVAAVAFLVVVMVALVIMVMAVLMLMIVAAALVLMIMIVIVAMVVMVVMVLVHGLVGELFQLGFQRPLVLHGLHNGRARQLLPGRGDDGGLVVVLSQKRHGGLQLLFVHAAGRLSTMALAWPTWSSKNSPKFFIYILHLFASATVVKLFSVTSSMCRFCTARITSLSLPTPDGSIKMRSGW